MAEQACKKMTRRLLGGLDGGWVIDESNTASTGSTVRAAVGEVGIECGLSKRMLFRSSSTGDAAELLPGLAFGAPIDCKLAELDWAEEMGDVGVDENSVAAWVSAEIKLRLR